MKSLRMFVLIAIALFSFSPLCLEQALAAEPLRIAVDYARFRGDDSNVYVEFYYSIPARLLTYTPDSAGLKAMAEVTLMINRGDSTVNASRWLVPHTVRDSSRLSSAMNLVGLSSVMIPPGSYSVRMNVLDRNNEARRDSVVFKLPIAMPDKQKLVLSDVELATSIRQGSKGSQFFKNTLEVVPNVEGVFSENQNCFIYAEVYNILAAGDSGDYVLKTAVYDGLGREIISREKPKKRAGESSVIADNIVTENLRTGTYTLMLSLQDSTGNVMSSSGKKFFIYNKALGIDSSMLALKFFVPAEEFAGMSEEDLNREFQWAKYEANGAEKDQFAALAGIDSKKKFLQEFWSRREPGKRTEYLNRVRHSNNFYRYFGMDGYRTDRGRVYITYGQPDDYDRHPNESDTRPYEVWYYNSIQGGVIFVFELRQSGGDYELVHSTHRNELHDPAWSQYSPK